MRSVLALCLLFLSFLTPIHAQTCADTHLTVGERGQVIGTPNRLRDAPSLAGTRTGEIPPNSPFTILALGDCEGDIRWVQIEHLDQTGWTAEASGAEYFIEPLVAAPSDNTAQIFALDGDYGRASLSSDGERLAYADGDAVVVVSVPGGETLSRLPIEGNATPIFSPTETNQLILFWADGENHVIDLASGETIYRLARVPRPEYSGGEFFYPTILPPVFLDSGRVLLQNDETIVALQNGVQVAELDIVPMRQQWNIIAVDGALQRTVLVPRLMYTPNDTPEISYPTFYNPANNSYTLLDRGGAYAQINDVRLSSNGLIVVTTDTDEKVTVWDLMTLIRTDLGSTPADTRVAHRLITLPAGGLYARIEIDRTSAFDIKRRVVVFGEDDVVMASVNIPGSLTGRVEAHLSGDGRRLLVEQQLGGIRVYDVGALIVAGEVAFDAGAIVTPTGDVYPAQPISLTCGLPVVGLQVGATVKPAGDSPARLRRTPSLTAEQIGTLAPDQTAVFDTGRYICVDDITWVAVLLPDGPFGKTNVWVAASTPDDVLLIATPPDGAPQPFDTALGSPSFNADGSIVFARGVMGVLAFDVADLSAPRLLANLTGGRLTRSTFFFHPTEPQQLWAIEWQQISNTAWQVDWRKLNWLTSETLQSLSLPEVDVFALKTVIPDSSGEGLYFIGQDLFAYVDFASGSFAKLVEDVTNNGLIDDFTLSSNGRYFAYIRRQPATDIAQSVNLFEKATGQSRVILTFDGFPPEPVIRAISPSGEFLAVTVARGVLAVWSTGDQPSELYQIPFVGGQFAQFTPDGAHLVVNDHEGIIVFDAADGRELERFDLPADRLNFSLDGNRAVSIDTNRDGVTTLTVYQLPDWEVVSRYSIPTP